MSHKLMNTNEERNKKRMLFNGNFICCNVLVGISLGFAFYLICNALILKTAINSIVIPSIALLLGSIIGLYFVKKQLLDKICLSKKVLKKELISDLYIILGIMIAIGLCCLLTKFNLIWISGISLSFKSIIVSFTASFIISVLSFWVTYFICKISTKILLNIKQNISEDLQDDKKIEI